MPINEYFNLNQSFMVPLVFVEC